MSRSGRRRLIGQRLVPVASLSARADFVPMGLSERMKSAQNQKSGARLRFYGNETRTSSIQLDQDAI
jgi:hypothetical protein